ncbi:MAG: hypothetical protein P4M08_12240 [Oligoflexia bacterium]|nr:hypothetical protein [Oligoflexia bacterium]
MLTVFRRVGFGSLLLSLLLSQASLAEVTGAAPSTVTPPPGGYEVIPRGTPVRGHFWISDGIADVSSSNQSAGNRFRIGGEAQLGPDYRFILGITAFDLLSSGESSTDVGDISRYNWDFNFGLFIVPDVLWAEYSFQLGNVSGSNIAGDVGTTGHGLTVGYRFYDKNKVNIGVEFGYQHIFSENVSTFNWATQAVGNATYPGANVYSLSVVFGVDVGGR